MRPQNTRLAVIAVRLSPHEARALASGAGARARALQRAVDALHLQLPAGHEVPALCSARAKLEAALAAGGESY